MGGTHANVLNHIESEFERVSGRGECQVNGDDVWERYDAMVENSQQHDIGFRQLAGIQQLEGLPVDVYHLGVLFVLDSGKSGRFTLTDVKSFAHWCAKNIPKNVAEESFQQEVQCQAVLQLWRACSDVSNPFEFVAKWFLDILYKSDQKKNYTAGEESPCYTGHPTTPTTTKSGNHSQEDDPLDVEGFHFRRSHIELLYQLCSVSECYGLDFQSFYNLFLVTSLNDEDPAASNLLTGSHDKNISYDVVLTFVRQFVSSYFTLLGNLGLGPLLTSEIHQHD